MINRLKLKSLIFSIFIPFIPTAAFSQLGALGGVSGIEEGGKVVGPLVTLSGEVGAPDQGSLGFYLFYTQATRSFGKPLDEVYAGDPKVRFIYEILFFNYNPYDVLQIAVMAPYVKENVEITREEGVEKTSVSGLFNPVIRAKYQFLSHPFVSLALSVLPPTGFSDIGTNTLDIRTAIAMTYKFSFVRLDAEAGYQFAGVWTDGPAPNDSISANIAFSREAGERLSVFLEGNYSYGGFLRVGEKAGTQIIIREEYQRKLDLTPGIRVKIADRLFTTVASRIALFNYYYLGYHYFYSIGIDYAF